MLETDFLNRTASYELLDITKMVRNEAPASTSANDVATSLVATRALRLSDLQNKLPVIHWAVITLLGCSILLCFMLETDKDTVQFLDGA